jgi:hypothetical protein
MKAIHCIFIDHSNRRASHAAGHRNGTKRASPRDLSRGYEKPQRQDGSVQKRQPETADPFPGVDRSRDDRRLPPIEGANGGLMRPAQVTLTIHPPVDTAPLNDKQTRDLTERLSKIIEPAN